MAKAKVDGGKCLGCGMCTGVCPVGAITIGADGKAVVNEEACIGCGACAGVCNAQAVEVK